MENLTNDEIKNIVKKIEEKQEELMALTHEASVIFNKLPKSIKKQRLNEMGIDFEHHPSIILSMTLRDPDDENRTKYFLATIGVGQSIIGNFAKLYDNEEMNDLSKVARKAIKAGMIPSKVGRKENPKKKSGIIDFEVSIKREKTLENELTSDFQKIRKLLNSLPDDDMKPWLIEQVDKLDSLFKSVKDKELSQLEKIQASIEAATIINEIEKKGLHDLFNIEKRKENE